MHEERRLPDWHGRRRRKEAPPAFRSAAHVRLAYRKMISIADHRIGRRDPSDHLAHPGSGKAHG
jgi:hypothetical protein